MDISTVPLSLFKLLPDRVEEVQRLCVRDLLCLDLQEVTVMPSEQKALLVGSITADQIPHLSPNTVNVTVPNQMHDGAVI